MLRRAHCPAMPQSPLGMIQHGQVVFCLPHVAEFNTTPASRDVRNRKLSTSRSYVTTPCACDMSTGTPTEGSAHLVTLFVLHVHRRSPHDDRVEPPCRVKVPVRLDERIASQPPWGRSRRKRAACAERTRPSIVVRGAPCRTAPLPATRRTRPGAGLPGMGTTPPRPARESAPARRCRPRTAAAAAAAAADSFRQE